MKINLKNLKSNLFCPYCNEEFVIHTTTILDSTYYPEYKIIYYTKCEKPLAAQFNYEIEVQLHKLDGYDNDNKN